MEATSDTLRQTAGFVVEDAGGRVGIVDSLHSSTRSGIPDFLVVRAGRLSRRRMLIGVDDIREILPQQKRIRLQGTWMTIRV